MSLVSFGGYIYVYTLHIFVTLCNSYCASMSLRDLNCGVLPNIQPSIFFCQTNSRHCCSNQLHVGLTRYHFAAAATPVATLYPRVHSPPWYAQTGSTRESPPCVATLIISREGMGLKDISIVALLLIPWIGNSESHYVCSSEVPEGMSPICPQQYTAHDTS